MSNCKSKQCCDTNVTQKSINENISLSVDNNNVLLLTIGNKISKVELPSRAGGWIESNKIIIPITSNGQVLFTNIIPTDQQLASVYLNGILQDESYYTVTNNINLTWITQLYNLEISDTLQIQLTENQN